MHTYQVGRRDCDTSFMQFDLARALATQKEGKALGVHPALMDHGTPVSVYSPGASRQRAVLTQREAKRHGQAYGGDQAIDWVYDCVNLYADTTATAEWHLEKEDGTVLVKHKDKLTPPDYEEGPEDLYRLLEEPNPHMAYSELIELLTIDLLLVGNAYWLKWRMNEAGRPLRLYRLAPAYVKIIPGAFGPERYEYQPPGAREPLKLPTEQVVHFKRPNPHDAYYGMGMIKGGGRSYDLELSVTDTAAHYYENRADPSLIVSAERRVPRDVFRKLNAQLRARVSGSHRAGELLVLESGLKASTLTPSARDALMIEAQKMGRDRTYSHFRASPKLFGITESGSGSDKVSDARREFDTYVIRPYMNKVQELVTLALTRAWAIKYLIDYRYTLPHEELLKNVGTLAAIPGIKVREVRRQLAPLGLRESTGDPVIDEMILNEPGEEMDENGQGGAADRNLPGEPGRPPKGSSTRALTRKSPTNKNSAVASGKALADRIEEHNQRLIERAEFQERQEAGLTTLEALQARLAAAEGKAVVKFQEPDRATVGTKLPDEQRPPDPYAAQRKSDIDAGAAFLRTALADAATALERDLLDHVEGKAFKPNDLVNRIRKSAAWDAFRDRVRAAISEGMLRSVSSAVMHQAGSGRIPEDELDYEAIVARVLNRPKGVNSIVKTLKKAMTAKFANDLTAESTREDAEKLVRDQIREWSTGRANVIADTEATLAYNEATLTVAEETGATEVYVTDGDDHDQPCQDANGMVWTVEQARERRIEHPNCRRAFVPLGAVA